MAVLAARKRLPTGAEIGDSDLFADLSLMAETTNEIGSVSPDSVLIRLQISMMQADMVSGRQ
jgi:hypothetical protein